MINEQEKYNKLREARDQSRRDKARENLKKSSTGKNRGLAQSAIGSAKNLAKNASPAGFLSLILKANLMSDWMYALALIAAIVKDFLDFIQVTGVFYILVIVITFLCSIFIAMMMLLGSFSNGSMGRVQRKVISSWVVLIGGTVAELLFGIDLLPIETFTVLVVYALMLSDRRQAAEEGKSSRRISATQESYAQ